MLHTTINARPTIADCALFLSCHYLCPPTITGPTLPVGLVVVVRHVLLVLHVEPRRDIPRAECVATLYESDGVLHGRMPDSTLELFDQAALHRPFCTLVI